MEDSKMSTTVLSKVNLGPHHNHVGGNVENTQLCRRYPCMCSKELFFIIIIDKRIVYGHHKYQNHQNYTKPTKTSIKLVLIPRFRRNFPTLKKTQPCNLTK